MEIKDDKYIITFLDGSVREFNSLQGANLRGANLKGAILVGADLERADLQGADLYKANLHGADLYKADLQGAILVGADLERADLERADLEGADLYKANLEGADLRGADLQGADLAQAKSVIGFYLGKHFGFYTPHDNYCQIGCKGMRLDDWLGKYQEIGAAEEYSEQEIRVYGAMLKMLKEVYGA